MEKKIAIEDLLNQIFQEDKKEKDKNVDLIRENVDAILKEDSQNIFGLIFHAKYMPEKKDGNLFASALERVLGGIEVLATAVKVADGDLEPYAQEMASALEMFTQAIMLNASLQLLKITFESIANVEKTLSLSLLPLKYIAEGEPKELVAQGTDLAKAVIVLNEANLPFDFAKAKDKGADGIAIAISAGTSLGALTGDATAPASAIVGYKLLLHSYACEESTIISLRDKCNDAYRNIKNPMLKTAASSIKDDFDKEVRDKLKPIEEKKERERKQKVEEYWASHKEEKKQIEERIKKINDEISTLKKEISVHEQKKKELKIHQEISEISREIEKKESKRASLGLFKFKEKRELEKQIDELKVHRRGKDQIRQKQENGINNQIGKINKNVRALETEQTKLETKLALPPID